MKINYSKLIFTVLILLALCIGGSWQKASAQPVTALSFQIFYDELIPFGDWIYEERFGYVWVPDETDFHPYYTNGYWEMTTYGNTWVSLYAWGWGPFHYGRWTYDPFYGWIWIPGYQWAPAWVCWRYGNGLYGWAPLGPVFVMQAGFGNYDCPDNWWVFTPQHYLYGNHYRTYYHRNRNHKHIRTSSVIERTAMDRETNRPYPTGPSVEDIRMTTGQSVTVGEIRDVASPEEALPNTTSATKVIRLYRPTLTHSEEAQLKAVPAKFQHVPRPIRADQPVAPGRRNIPEYKKAERGAPSQTGQPNMPKEPAHLTPPVQKPARRPHTEQQGQPKTKPVKPATRQEKTEPTRRSQSAPRVEPKTIPARPQQPGRKP